MYTGWRKRRQIHSPYRVGGETGYNAKEDLKSVNSYNTGKGRLISVWFFCSCIPRPSLVAPALSSLGHHMRKTWVRSLGLENPLSKGMVTHYSILAWRIPWTEEPSKLQSMGSQRVRHG